jgi:hypothetical protein
VARVSLARAAVSRARGDGRRGELDDERVRDLDGVDVQARLLGAFGRAREQLVDECKLIQSAVLLR